MVGVSGIGKVGGDEINKFVGSLDAERRKRSESVTGFFISLAGFKDSALEQEDELGNARCVLVGDRQIITELEAANVLTHVENALTRAAEIAPPNTSAHVADGDRPPQAHKVGFW